MRLLKAGGGVVLLLLAVLAVLRMRGQAPVPSSRCDGPPSQADQRSSYVFQPINLVEQLAAGRLRGVNREVAALQGSTSGVHVTEKAGPGVVWIADSDFGEGTISVDVCGRDVLQRSFVGIAFHRSDDRTYEAVYLRPFNFQNENSARRQHAVQYIAVPEYDWPRLRQQFPEEFENPVDPSVAPTEWIPLRVVVGNRTIRVYVGSVTSPALEVRELGGNDGGMIGLWTGNYSDGNFASLRYTPAK